MGGLGEFRGYVTEIVGEAVGTCVGGCWTHVEGFVDHFREDDLESSKPISSLRYAY